MSASIEAFVLAAQPPALRRVKLASNAGGLYNNAIRKCFSDDGTEGYLEAVPHTRSYERAPWVAYVDEDGVRKRLPTNAAAAPILAALGFQPDSVVDLRGNVVLCGNQYDPEEGAIEVTIAPDVAERVMAIAAECHVPLLQQ